MAVQTIITITHGSETAQQIDGYLKVNGTGNRHQLMKKITNYLEGVMSGTKNASLDVQLPNSTTLAKASGTITFTGAPTANDTCSINGVTFTAVASGATGNQFNISGTNTSAANLAAAINASASAAVSGVVTAAAVAGVVTVTAVTAGKGGNSLTLSTSLTNTTASASTLTGGANATATVYHFGV